MSEKQIYDSWNESIDTLKALSYNEQTLFLNEFVKKHNITQTFSIFFPCYIHVNNHVDFLFDDFGLVEVEAYESPDYCFDREYYFKWSLEEVPFSP